MWDKIKIFLSNMWVFIYPFIKQFIVGVGPTILTLAISVCTKYQVGDLSSEQKREAAFVEIKETLLAKGIEVGTSVINSAIESAVAYIKSKATDGAQTETLTGSAS